MGLAMSDENQDERVTARKKWVGRIVLIIFGLMLAVYLLPLFIPALRFI